MKNRIENLGMFFNKGLNPHSNGFGVLLFNFNFLYIVVKIIKIIIVINRIDMECAIIAILFLLKY